MVSSFSRVRRSAPARTSRTREPASRQNTTAMPTNGTRIRAIDNTAIPIDAQSRATQATSNTRCCSAIPARPRRTNSGRCQIAQPSAKVSTGTTTSTQPVTTRRACGRSSLTRGSVGCPGRRLRSTGPTRAKRSGTPAASART